jgi:hypothetical protein
MIYRPPGAQAGWLSGIDDRAPGCQFYVVSNPGEVAEWSKAELC